MDISRWISGAAARTPANTAVRFEGSELTYRDLEWRVGALAGVLADAGASRGDRVAYLGPNCPELLEALFACARLGAIFVPLNARMTAAELRLFSRAGQPGRSPGRGEPVADGGRERGPAADPGPEILHRRKMGPPPGLTGS
jgi:acyl-CoA synthetase (AMP-forming)/AMP-acid ligase II